jgi:8-oxo-dGTP diphosphatase
VEVGEAPKSALKRELMEELQLDVEVGDPIGNFKSAVNDTIIALDCYWIHKFQGDIQITSHSECAWVNESDLQRIDFSEPDLPAVISILARGA